MISYQETLAYLYGLQGRGMKFGLRNIRRLMAYAGHPESGFPSVHIAGTNGKGSTAAFLASIMMEAGCRTGLYTSPHLVRFTERIRINGREIPEKLLAQYAAMLRPAIEEVHATFFEATTCIAFLYFADERIDIAIVETGLGGRLDSTNVILPLASVVTNIGFDHTEILGKTMGAIAREKAGIIKNHVPCVTSSNDPVALRVLSSTAHRRHAILHQARRTVRCSVNRFDRLTVSFRSPSFSVPNVRLGLSGVHQILNAQLTLAVVEVMRRGRHPLPGRINASTLKAGLENVAKNSRLRGRFEHINRSGRYILDVAHNPEGIQTLVSAIRSEGRDKLVVVFGVMKDKDYVSMIRALAGMSQCVIAVAPSMKRALDAKALYRTTCSQGLEARLGGTVADGILLARQMHRWPVVVTGSHYVVGEALQILDGKRA